MHALRAHVFLYSGLAHALKSPEYTPGRLKHELRVVLDEKARAFGKTSKTKQKGKCGLALALPGQKRALARAFWSKYDQNYGLHLFSRCYIIKTLWWLTSASLFCMLYNITFRYSNSDD
jgi:hypothetical protein